MKNIIIIFKNINFKISLFLILLVLLLIFLSILEMIGLASIPLLLSSILVTEKESFVQLDFWNLKNILFELSPEDQVQFISIFIICLFLFKNIFHAAIIFYQGRIIKSIKIYLSKKLFSHYLNQNYLFLLKKNSSDMLRTLSVDVGNTTIYILNLLNFFKEVLILIAIVFLLFLSNVEITIFLFGSFLIIASVFFYFNKKKLFNRGKIIQNLSSELIRTIYETIGLFKELKIYDLKFFQYKNFSKKISITEKNFFLNYFTTSLPRLFLELTAVILIISIILFQLNKNSNIVELLPYFSLIVVVSIRLIPLFNGLTTSLSSLKTIQPSFDLVFDEIKKVNRNKKTLKVKFLNFKKKISFKNVDFKYDNKKEIIENLSLEIYKGDKIGIVGESGVGKSTLVNLMIGLLKPSSGEIYVDETKLSNDENQIIRNISYVPQEIFLIEDTLKKNIALGINEENIDSDKIDNVAKISQINSFIVDLKDKFETKVTEGGKNFSMGQKQRLGVARALYRDPDIIILDESTSSLDASTEKKFIDDIFEIFKDKTIIFISHKLSALIKCNKIFDLKKKIYLDK